MGKWVSGAAVFSLSIGLLVGMGTGSEPVAAQSDGYWDLSEVIQNPDGVVDVGWDVTLTLTSLSGVRNHGAGNDLENDDLAVPVTVTWDALPQRLAPGEEFTRRVTISVGPGSGPASVQIAYTSLWGGRPEVSIGHRCVHPEPGGDPVCETSPWNADISTNYEHQPGQASGDVSFTAAGSGDTFDFSSSVLNCGAACVTVWRYVWVAETQPANGSEPEPADDSPLEPVDSAVDRDGCVIAGSVRVGEFPLRTFSVRMEAGEISATIGTDAQGNFDFGEIDDYGPDGVAAETFQLFFEAEDFTPSVGRVRIYWNADAAVLATTPRDIGPGDCRVDLDLSAVPDAGFVPSEIPPTAWREIGLSFRDLADSLKLSDDLGFELDAVRPLPVLLHCEGIRVRFEGETSSPVDQLLCPEKAHGAHYVTGSHIALRARSAIDVVFGDVMLHEFGHAFMHDTFGNDWPVSPGSKNHEGYWVNRDSSDSMAEGFASFWSSIVRKEIRQDADWPVYRFRDGSIMNLELNTRAWASWVGEERAFAGVLVDLLDGGRQGVAQNELITEVRFSQDNDGVQSWCGTVRNTSDRIASGVSVLVSTNSSTEFARFLGVDDPEDGDLPSSTIEPSAEALWCANVEGGRSEIEVEVEDFGGTDDDGVQVTLASLLGSLVAITSEDGSPHPETVADVYEGLAKLVNLPADSERTDGFDGVAPATLDDIFVSHGFFADMANRSTIQQFDGVARGEVIGRTDHFAAPVGSDGPLMRPRRNSTIEGYYWARLDSAIPDDVVVTVQIIPDLPTTAAVTYSVRPNEDGDFLIDAPPDDPGAIVRVYATNPTLETPAWVTIDEFTSGEWHEAPVQPTGAPMREYQTDVSSLASVGSPGSGSTVQVIVLIVVGFGAALGLGELVRLRSRRRAAAKGQAGATAGT